MPPSVQSCMVLALFLTESPYSHAVAAGRTNRRVRERTLQSWRSPGVLQGLTEKGGSRWLPLVKLLTDLFADGRVIGLPGDYMVAGQACMVLL